MTKSVDPVPPDFDWSVTTFEGARREQLRQWARLPLADLIRALEEMEAQAERFTASTGSGAT